jgi:cytochrome c oxidase subunit IV
MWHRVPNKYEGWSMLMHPVETKLSDSLRAWGLLVVLLVASALVPALGLRRSLALTLIYGAATAQSVIIARYYMRLRSEDLMIYALALLPVALIIILGFVIGPDVGTFR